MTDGGGTLPKDSAPLGDGTGSGSDPGKNPTPVYVSPDDLKVLQYLQDHINENVYFYPSMHRECPEGSRWATWDQLMRLRRKKLVWFDSSGVPTRVWPTEAGLDRLKA